MPHRSRVSGRYMPASRQLADRLDKVEVSVERGFDALRPLDGIAERAAAGPLGPDDIAAMAEIYSALWSALERVGDDLDDVRKLVGVAHA